MSTDRTEFEYTLSERLAKAEADLAIARKALEDLKFWNEGILAGRGNHHPQDHLNKINEGLRSATGADMTDNRSSVDSAELLARDFDHWCWTKEGSPIGLLKTGAAARLAFEAGYRLAETRASLQPATPTVDRSCPAGNGEPVAYRWKYEDETSWTLAKSRPDHLYYKDVICEPLYCAPAQAAPTAGGGDE